VCYSGSLSDEKFSAAGAGHFNAPQMTQILFKFHQQHDQEAYLFEFLNGTRVDTAALVDQMA